MPFLTAAAIQQRFDDENPVTPAQYQGLVTTSINKQIKNRYKQLGYGTELALEIPIYKSNRVASLALWESNVAVIETQLITGGWITRTESQGQTIIFISLP